MKIKTLEEARKLVESPTLESEKHERVRKYVLNRFKKTREGITSTESLNVIANYMLEIDVSLITVEDHMSVLQQVVEKYYTTANNAYGLDIIKSLTLKDPQNNGEYIEIHYYELHQKLEIIVGQIKRFGIDEYRRYSRMSNGQYQLVDALRRNKELFSELYLDETHVLNFLREGVKKLKKYCL